MNSKLIPAEETLFAESSRNDGIRCRLGFESSCKGYIIWLDTVFDDRLLMVTVRNNSIVGLPSIAHGPKTVFQYHNE